MSSLTIALNNAISGLRINQQSLGVLSQNIANVNTEGYSRQNIQQSAIVLGGIGQGVQIDDIIRKVDKYLQRSVQNQGSVANSTATVSEYYQRVQAYLGQPGASNSLDTFMTTFFNSLQTLSNTPETVSYRSNALQAGAQLATQISNLAQNLEDLRFQADRDILDAVTIINTNIAKLEKLNVNISTAKALGQSTADQLDQRDQALRAIAEQMDISVTFDNFGAVNVVAANGVAIVEIGTSHRLQYTPVQSSAALAEDAILSPLNMITTAADGSTSINSVALISGGTSTNVNSGLISGKIAGLQQIRDAVIPEVLNQLDMLASRLRDTVNAVQNQGSGFPPPASLTGERLVRSSDQYEWSGTVRIAVLKADGKPVMANYADESGTGMRPLTLDLGSLDSGDGVGKPTMQTIVDEINNHFGAPGNKVKVGNLNNTQLVSDNTILPSGAPNFFNFDFDNENISRNTAGFFVTGITVLDDTATNITSVTKTAPSFSLATTGTYATTAGSADVTVSASALSGVAVGDTIYMNGPGIASVDGIPAANLTGYFTVKAVSGNQFTITANPAVTAVAGGAFNDAAPGAMMAAYGTIEPGAKERTKGNGTMQVDLTANTGSLYYDITATVGVVDQVTGVVSTSQVTYRVNNNARDLLNARYDVTAATVGGTVVAPITSQETLKAILVDENGAEIAKVNGKYIDAPSYLKIVGGVGGTNTSTTSYSVAIDEMDSKQLGKPTASPSEEGTNWGFSHYFGLNNFFKSNEPTTTGDAVKNSAINLEVDDRIVKNPNLIATGKIKQQVQPANTTLPAQYTYVLYSGDNIIAAKLANLSTQTVSFDQSGGLPNTTITLQSYTSNFLGYTSSQTNAAADTATNAKALFDGFKSRQQSTTGVNLDEELANTITFQNAYSATARVVSVVNDMYESLINAV